MTLKNVRNVAKQGGVGLDGVRIRVIRDQDLKGKGVFGYTHSDGKTIDLYPDAFKSKEELIKTLGHERTHIYQIRTFGNSKDTFELFENGKAAYGIEDPITATKIKDLPKIIEVHPDLG